METLFSLPILAAGYATSRPAVHPHVIERIQRRLQLTEHVRRALDIGCGAGLSTQPLGRIARQCIGIEPVEAMLQLSAQVAPDALFVAGNAEALPFPSQSIDVITAAGSLNYASLDSFFPEAARVLAPAGILIVYDFSQGRSFRDSPDLGTWFQEFAARYPAPPNAARKLDPSILAGLPSGFSVREHEEFEVGLRLDPDFYLAYVLTETNVAYAIRNGTPAEEIRSWCAGTLRNAFRGESHEVMFRGYIAYMVAAT